MSWANVNLQDRKGWYITFLLDPEEDLAVKKCLFLSHWLTNSLLFFRVPTNHFLLYPEVEWGAQPLHPHLYLGVTWGQVPWTTSTEKTRSKLWNCLIFIIPHANWVKVVREVLMTMPTMVSFFFRTHDDLTWFLINSSMGLNFYEHILWFPEKITRGSYKILRHTVTFL